MKDSEVLDKVVDLIHAGINYLDTTEQLDDFEQGESFVYHMLLGYIMAMMEDNNG